MILKNRFDEKKLQKYELSTTSNTDDEDDELKPVNSKKQLYRELFDSSSTEEESDSDNETKNQLHHHIHNALDQETRGRTTR